MEITTDTKETNNIWLRKFSATKYSFST